MWRGAARVWALVGVAGCGLVTVVSLLPWVPPLPDAVGFVLAFMSVGSWCIAVVSGFEYRRREAVTGPAAGRVVLGVVVPDWLTWWVVVLAVAFGVSVAWALQILPGTPEVHAGRYWFDDHGTHIATTAAGYRDGLRQQLRLLVGVPGLFHLIALVSVDRLHGTSGRQARSPAPGLPGSRAR